MKITWTQNNQPRPYTDTLRFATITTDGEDEVAVLAFLQERHTIPKHRSENGCYNGACGFPFGLAAYFSLQKAADGTWRYRETVPFCD